MFPIDVVINNSDIMAMHIVPMINAFGITFSGSFVSSAKKVADSHPKNVSWMKYIVMKIAEAGKTKKGVKFAGCSLNIPGIINENAAVRVIIENVTNMNEEVFIPLNAI